MKIAIATVATVFAIATAPAEAGHHGHGRGHHGHNHHGHRTAELIIPVLIGGVIGYEIARQNPPVIITQPQVIVSPPVAPRGQVQQPMNVPGIECPAGTAPFLTHSYDHYNRPVYTISCR